jgi:hypothetical protein
MLVKVAPRRVGNPGRIATVALRAGPVTLKRPRNGFAKTDPETVSHSLAWLAWIATRLGGWNCYYKPPGPKTMRAG